MRVPLSSPLSHDQKQFFETFGFLVFEGFFSADELETIHREFDYKLAEQYPDTPYDGSRRHWAMMLEDDTPFFASLLEDPRFLNTAQQLFGDDVLGVGTDVNRYTGDTRWHPDTGSIHQYGVKFAFYLDPVDADGGALRVIPASHRLPKGEDFASGVSALTLQDVPCAALASRPGDVVAFDLRLWHASCGGSSDRQMCTVVYYNNPKNEDELAALSRQGERAVNASVKKFNTKQQYLYSKRWLSNPGGNPARQHWIDRLRGIGFYDAPGVAEG